MDPNHTATPAWRDPPGKKRTVKAWRPSEDQLQILREIYDEETDTPTEDRRERIIATLKEHAPAATLAVTDRDVKSWFQNRKRDNRLREKSEGKIIQPSPSREESSEHAEPVTSWRPNESQHEILWDVYNEGNGTPPQARRRKIIEALCQHGLDSQKEIVDCTLQVHRPAPVTITDRNVKAWLDKRYQDSDRLREKGSLQSRASEVRDEVQLLETQLQILRQLHYDQEKGSPDKKMLKEIIARFNNQDRPIAETNEILRSVIVAENVRISRRRQREEQLATLRQILTKLYQESPDEACRKKITAIIKMHRPIAVKIVQLRGLIVTENVGTIEDDETSIIRKVRIGDRAVVLKFRLPRRPRSEARMRDL